MSERYARWQKQWLFLEDWGEELFTVCPFAFLYYVHTNYIHKYSSAQVNE